MHVHQALWRVVRRTLHIHTRAFVSLSDRVLLLTTTTTTIISPPLQDEPIPDDVGDRFAGSAAKALYDYAGESEENLSFKVGDLINIIVQGQDGWWEGECDNRFGMMAQRERERESESERE